MVMRAHPESGGLTLHLCSQLAFFPCFSCEGWWMASYGNSQYNALPGEKHTLQLIGSVCLQNKDGLGLIN